MKKKKGKPNFNMSEPEFLISVMDRHNYWAVIVCLIGGGQKINTGEAGLPEWFGALRRKFSHWNVCAARLKPFGIWTQSKIEAKNWFLNEKDDVRSSYFLEDTATEFDIQGLELDWTIVAWDANFRFVNGEFIYQNFTGSKWLNINKSENVLYLKNAYRVLLTRARQGMVIFIPVRDDNDPTRQESFYDGTYEYFKEIGIPILE